MVLSGEAGVNSICSLLGLSKYSYYRSQRPEERLEKKYLRLKPMIEEIISSNPGYGLPRIKVALRREYGEVVNHKLLRKLLGTWGLSLRRAKQKKKSWIKKVLDFLQRRSNLLRKAAIDGCFKAC